MSRKPGSQTGTNLVNLAIRGCSDSKVTGTNRVCLTMGVAWRQGQVFVTENGFLGDSFSLSVTSCR